MKLNTSKISIEMARKCMNKTQLAQKAGISRSRIYTLLNSQNVTFVSAGRIARALGVDVTEIIEDI